MKAVKDLRRRCGRREGDATNSTLPPRFLHGLSLFRRLRRQPFVVTPLYSGVTTNG